MPSLRLVSQLVSQRCSLGLQLAMVSKQSMQLFQTIEPSLALCNRCKARKFARQIANGGYVTRCNLPATCLETPLSSRKIAPCSTSCRAPFYFLQQLQRFFETIETIESCSRSLQTIFETITSCSSGLQRVTCLLQLAMNFFFHHCLTKLQGKLHRVSLA